MSRGRQELIPYPSCIFFFIVFDLLVDSFSLHSMGGSLSNIAPPQHLPLPSSSSSSSSSSFTGSSRLRNFLQENKLKGKIVSSADTDLICDAVTVKSLIWQVKAGPCICLVLSIDDKVDHNLVAQAVSTLPSFAVSPITRKDVTLAGHDTAREESGYDIGTIPPVGHTKQMPIFMDLSLVNRLKDYGKYFCGGGGEVGYELLISLNQLLKLDYMCIKPISKNFQVEHLHLFICAMVTSPVFLCLSVYAIRTILTIMSYWMKRVRYSSLLSRRSI